MLARSNSQTNYLRDQPRVPRRPPRCEVHKNHLGARDQPSKTFAGRETNGYLEGSWQPDLLFVLKQEQECYEFCQKQVAECDRQLAQYLQQREDHSQSAPLPEEKRKGRLRKTKKGNTPQFDMREGLFRMTGTDLTRIDGIDVMTATTVISETGYDMSTGHRFAVVV